MPLPSTNPHSKLLAVYYGLLYYAFPQNHKLRFQEMSRECFSLCSPRCPQTYSPDQAGHKLRDLRFIRFLSADGRYSPPLPSQRILNFLTIKIKQIICKFKKYLQKNINILTSSNYFHIPNQERTQKFIDWPLCIRSCTDYGDTLWFQHTGLFSVFMAL